MGMEELPEGWSNVKVGEVATLLRGVTYSRDQASSSPASGTKPILRANNINGELNFDDLVYVPESLVTPEQLISLGDIVFAMSSGSKHLVGKSAKARTAFDGSFGAFCGLLRANEATNKDFLHYVFQGNDFRRAISEVSKGSNINNLKREHILEFEFLFPPIAEQHRIVVKIDELFSELDQGVASLKTAQAQLKVYRQSLLKNAFSGKLTAKWRAAHRDELETAAVLQQRIASERAARYQQQLAAWQAAGQAGPKPKTPKSLPPLTPEELAELPELPEGWGWVRLGCVVDAVSGNTPKGIEQTSGQDVPFYRVSDMNREGNELYMCSSATYLSKVEADGLGLMLYPAGTILFPKRGGAIATNKKRRLLVPACFDLNLMGLTNLPKGIELDYLWNWVLSFDLASISDGSNVPQINNRNVEPLAFPVCSLIEQLTIVQELESKLSEADQLDQTLATALQQAEALRQSILKKAFCGQLVPQDQNDEPAAVLLERIRAAQGKAKKNLGVRGRTPKSNMQNLHIALNDPEIPDRSCAGLQE